LAKESNRWDALSHIPSYLFMKNIAEKLFETYTGNDGKTYNSLINNVIFDIANLLGKYNIHYTIQNYFVKNNYYTNLLAYKPNRSNYILLQGHLDTFPVEGNYNYTINNDKIIGRGAVDMKGSLIGMIDAFIKTYNNDKEFSPMLLITTNEEANDFAGIKHFLKNTPSNIKFAINGEPNNFKLSTKMKGVMMFDYEKFSDNGHSSSNKISVIEENVDLICRVKEFCEKARKINNTIASFTLLNSGKVKNQFPDKFVLHFHLRTSENHNVYKQIDLSLVSKFKLTEYLPAETTVLKEIKDKFKSLEKCTFEAFSEANLLNIYGIDTVVCGIGDISLAHSEQNKEEITFEEIKKYSNFLISLYI